MMILKFLAITVMILLLVVLFIVKLIAHATGGYDSMEHGVLNGALVFVVLAILAAVIAL